jgi:hypothetical protein
VDLMMDIYKWILTDVESCLCRTFSDYNEGRIIHPMID